jgi:hypothetical protein
LFSLGEGLPFFERFIFYIDDNGIQDIKGPGRKRFVRLGLRDLSARLRKTYEKRDWTAPAVFTYSVVCDKTQPGKSLVHGIAQRAVVFADQIDTQAEAESRLDYDGGPFSKKLYRIKTISFV